MKSTPLKVQTLTARVLIAFLLIFPFSWQASAEEERTIVANSVATVFEKAVIDRVRIISEDQSGDEIESHLTFVQVFPKANREYTCLAVMDKGTVKDMDCFPIKTNPTPIMY